jgi:hypothetical protein
MHFALASIEDQILTDIETELVASVPDLCMNTYMFDGAIVRAPARSRAAIDDVLARVGGIHGVSFTVESFDTLGGSRRAQSQSDQLPTTTRRFVTPLNRCVCGKALQMKESDAVDATLYDCHQAEKVQHIRKRCRCGMSYSHNFTWVGGSKVNTVNLNMVDALFVSSSVGFTKTFLEYHVRLHYRGYLSSRAILWAGNGCIWDSHCVDDRWWKSFNDARFLLVAMKEFEGLPDHKHLHALRIGEVIPEVALRDLDNHIHTHDFPPAQADSVSAFAMDGHEKVTVRACGTTLQPIKRAGRPRTKKTARTGKRPYTCGWFMISNPADGTVLSVEEQKTPENNLVKKKCISKVIHLYKSVDAIIHDRCCSLMPDCTSNGLFAQIRFWSIDKWHGAKHKVTCKCRPQSNRRLARRLRGMNTSVSEQVFSWFRNYARTMNELRPDRHRLLVLHYCKLHNHMIRTGDRSHLNQYSVLQRTAKAAKKLLKRPAGYRC